MTPPRRRLLGACLLAAIALGAARPATALEIYRYDELSFDERVDYRTRTILIVINLLKSDRRPQDAETVEKLFTETSAEQKIPPGVKGFGDNIDAARHADRRRAEKGQPRLHVEHALAVTLKRFGVILTPDHILAAVEEDKKKAGSSR